METGPSDAGAGAAGPSNAAGGAAVQVVSAGSAMDTSLPVAKDGVLDATGSQLHSLESLELPESLTDLDLTQNRLKTLDPRVLALPGLTSLSFRQNLLTDASSISESKSASGLTQLVFHDNHLKQIPSLRPFSNLERLEMSYNEIRSLQPLTELVDAPLTEMFAANNKITSLEGVAALKKLQVLEVGSNRLKSVEHIEGLTELRQIWLGRNRISSVEGFPTLLNLTIIALPSNRLTSMLGVESCTNLEELYFSHNGISKIEGLQALTKLKVLDVASNMVEKIENLETLTELTDLWLNDNKIASFEGVAEAVQSQRTSLTCIYLENNPLAQKNPAYRPTLLDLFPHLEQLDSTQIRR
uniref:Protein phosphatase 1 regulatory subunit 7 n=1 Tax=Tetraselmis chuii TaxID=63592 RepID=A0A7S1SLH4_9CHLO|mmetsp:Transcript_17687/g.31533  ORF Transcript_17687/g.31533 Transcript_17687/m.31533 type:complete len:356 (+) Transcript_17687:320-1387(+)